MIGGLFGDREEFGGDNLSAVLGGKSAYMVWIELKSTYGAGEALEVVGITKRSDKLPEQRLLALAARPRLTARS